MNAASFNYCIKILMLYCFAMLANFYCIAQQPVRDTTFIKGSVAATGLVQTGDENRTVFSLLSVITWGTKKYEIEPLTSIAYSNKPHKQVEGEYLENIIFRYHQQKKFYPALALAADRSFLRKVDFRYTISFALVYNLLQSKNQVLKLGLGYSHEFAAYASGAFIPPINNKAKFSRNIEQLYARMKGEHKIGSFKITYDVFYQAALKDLADRRWFAIVNLDYAIAKHLAIRASALYSFEDFIATNVSQNNFRLTYGINFQF